MLHTKKVQVGKDQEKAQSERDLKSFIEIGPAVPEKKIF